MRSTHDDSGPPLGALGLTVQRALLDVESHLSQATVRLGNLLKAHPELGRRFPADGWLGAIKKSAREVKSSTPYSPCVYCWGKGEKAACTVCQGQRWGTKAELKAAPAELRAAAGL